MIANQYTNMTHPKVADEYNKHKVPIPFNANDVNETEFFQQTLPDTRKIAVNHIIRVVRGEKEFLLSNETMTGKTLEGNPRYLNKQFGSFPFPYFVMAYNPATGRPEANGRIDRWEERYEMPSSPAAIKKLFAKDQMGTNTSMTIDYGEGQQFVVNNKNDFINLPAEKLISKITGKSVEQITGGGPGRFVTSADEAQEARQIGNTQQEQEEARRKMYDFSLIANSSSTFGPTEEQKAAAQPTLAPQPVLNVVPSTVALSPKDVEGKEAEEIAKAEREERQEQVQMEQKPGEPKKAVGQSRATNRIGENVGVVLKDEDTGVKQNITRDSITIEEPQGQTRKDSNKDKGRQ